MITNEDLKQIVMLTYLTDPMLDRLAQIVDVLKFDKDEFVFRVREPAERFYMLTIGKILLEQRISDKVTTIVGSIKPGYSFGWSAMVEGGTYSADAICDEPCEVFSFKREKINKLFHQDPEMGFLIHQRLLVILKKRLDYRTEQFQQAIRHHPDMQKLFST
jgi:CRP-like cAMP-binding protein